MKTLHKSIASVITVAVSLLISCSEPRTPAIDLTYFYPDGTARTRGFGEVRHAKEGDLVTINGGIDVKGVCNNLRESQREICKAGFMRPGPGPDDKWDFIAIEIRMCSEQLRTNCMVYPPLPEGHDFRNVYVLDNAGEPIDFDGYIIIEPPRGGMYEPKNLRITGRLTVVDGEGRFIDPIVKIEQE